MLKQRIITAVVLLLVLGGALAAGRPAFAAALAVLMGAACFEWLRLAGHGARAAVTGAVLLAGALLAAELAAGWPHEGALRALGVAAIAVWVGVAFALVRAERGGVAIPRGLSTLLALLLLTAAWAALLALYHAGVVLMVSALAIVWVADIAAYFAGRAFGRRKLAPHISPGKTWAGAVGAWVAVLALAVVLAPYDALFSSELLHRLPWPFALAVLGVLVALSIVGDLFESLLKRQAGVKDSGKLLPGHGGVLDRIDALLPVLPAIALLRSWPVSGG
jgi:phosphatidate cytidylyltransferase